MILLIITLLIESFYLASFTNSGTFADDPATYLHAPPCAMDIDRNFSVQNAIHALDRASAAPNLASASNDLQTAWLNLEQVMNYGALQWTECVSCDPYKTIDGNPNHSYMKVAWRLIELSRNLHGRPDYNEYLGLVETMENRYQVDPYCGFRANQINVDHISDFYTFGRVRPSSTVLCGSSGDFALTKSWGNHGRPLKSCHFNESSYWLLENGQELVIVDGNGFVTSILSPQGPDDWEGPYKGDVSSGIIHYIKRDNPDADPCLRPTWYGKTVAPEVAYSGSFGFPGKSSWAKDGTRYWLINSSGFCNQYFVVVGKDIHVYGHCQNLISKLIYEQSRTNDFGHLQWEGYTQMPDGSKGRNWWLAWL